MLGVTDQGRKGSVHGGTQGKAARAAKRCGSSFAVLCAASSFGAGCGGERGAQERVETKVERATLAAGFQENLVISGRTAPVALRFAPNPGGAPLQAFLAEKSGLLFGYRDIATQSNPTQVIDLRTAVHDFWDRGLLGVAIHPDYPNTPEVYVLYTHDAFANLTGPRWGDACPSPPGATEDGCVVYGRLSRIDVDPVTLAGTEAPLIEAKWCQQYPSHSIGDMQFGSDGYLYLSSGDGASFTFGDHGQDGNPVNPCGDPGNPLSATTSEGGRLRSQDVLTNTDPNGFNGTILRVDIANGAVTAPPGNPLVGKGTTDDDFIIATGLRNPYRFTVRPGTNELWIADVGQDAWEELDRIVDPGGAVENFGWPCFEGPDVQGFLQNNVLCTQVRNQTYPAHVSPMVTQAPFYAYHHSQSVVAGDGCPTGSSSITGVAFNDKTAYPPAYNGALFFADSSRRCVWTMFAGTGGIPNPSSRGAFITNTSGRVVDIQMGPDGKLYYVDFDAGNVYRIDSFTGNQPPQAAFTATPTSGASPLDVAFDASASTDAEDGSNLSFVWDFDADGAFDDGTGVAPSFVFTAGGTHLVRVRATDSGGLSSIASLTVTVDNSPPVATILTPSASLAWAVGDSIAFSGQAVDPEDGPLPPSQLSWEMILQHCSSETQCHAHPITTVSGVASGSFVAPDHEYPSFLELRLTANDTAADWFDAAWQYRRALSMNHAGLGAVSNFPVLILLDPARIDYANTQPGGRDLRFTDAAGNVLAHEVAIWNPGGVSEVWVKVPSIAAGSTTATLLMYYGNPSAAVGEDAPAVWSNGYVGVWHMGESLADSTAFGHHGVNVGSTPSTGPFGPARGFNGVSSYVAVGTSAPLQVTGSMSLEAWARPVSATLTGFPRILSKKSVWNAAAGYNLEMSPDQNFFTMLAGGDNYLRANASINASFHYYASSLSGTTGALYFDGLNVTTDSSAGALAASTTPLDIGRSSAGTDYFTGDIDEVRVSNVSRPAAWFATQFRSMTDAYLTYGQQEVRASLSATASIELHPATAELAFASDPLGIRIDVGSRSVTTPAEPETLILGSRTTLSVVSPQIIGGTEYAFSAWSNGGAQTQLFELGGDASLTVTFTPVGQVLDSDGDGLPDEWETAFGLDPNDPSDAGLDADGDGLNNLEEFGAGTDPTNADSDGDGWDDFTELAFDGDPTDPAVTPDPPAVAVTSPAPGSELTGGEITVAFAVTGIALAGDHVHLTLDGGAPAMVPLGAGSFTFSGVAPGPHSVLVEVVGGDHQPYSHPGAAQNVAVVLVEAEGCAEAPLVVAAASASSTETPEFPASAAVDGLQSTRWSSQFAAEQWLLLDFGERRHVSRVELDWEAAYAVSYDVEVADAAAGPWTLLHRELAGDGGSDVIAGLDGAGRFVRIFTHLRATPWGNSLWEVRVHGDLDPGCDGDVEPVCGNGAVEAGEDCDTGGASATCDADCTLAACGDGVPNAAASEECDTGGASATCDADCTLPVCGDGVLNTAAFEDCDTGGASATCDVDCTLAACGDAVINSAAGEQCDDGNAVNDDLCTNSCVLATCTDAMRNAGETDVDCGGSCPADCAVGQNCNTGADCVTASCQGGVCAPPAPTCTDGVQNGNETGVDCGGSCPACGGGALTLTFPISTDWGGGYCATVSVANPTSSATTTWTARFNLNGATIYTSWNGNFSANSGIVTVTPISWNQVIGPGQTNATIGFCANRSSPGSVPAPVSATGSF